jgi:hypothetical protein
MTLSLRLPTDLATSAAHAMTSVSQSGFQPYLFLRLPTDRGDRFVCSTKSLGVHHEPLISTPVFARQIRSRGEKRRGVIGRRYEAAEGVAKRRLALEETRNKDRRESQGRLMAEEAQLERAALAREAAAGSLADEQVHCDDFLSRFSLRGSVVVMVVVVRILVLLIVIILVIITI